MPGRPALRVKTKKSASHGCLDGNLPSAEIGGKSNRLARGRDSEPRNTGKPINFFDLSLDFFFFDLVFYHHLFFSIFVLLFYPYFFSHVISSLFYLTCLGLKNLIIIVMVVSIDFFDFLLDFFLPLSCPWLRHVRCSSAY
jgi:hypothetical protein